MGEPWEERSPTEILAIKPEIRASVYDLMEQFYLVHKPEGLMFVSWDTIETMRGLWVRPADEFPGKAGAHPMTPDMRVLGGPFLFGECSSTESLAKPGYIMVACPINNEYDSWGYVSAVVKPEREQEFLRLVEFLAHRVTLLIYEVVYLNSVLHYGRIVGIDSAPNAKPHATAGSENTSNDRVSHNRLPSLFFWPGS